MNALLILGFDNMKVHEKLRILRNASGISQQYIAQELGIDPANYGRIERGEAKLTVDRLELILDILGCSIEQFFCANSKDSQYTEQLMQTLINEITELKTILTKHKNIK